MKRGKHVVGELDIDSHTLSAFDESDRMFLEWVCKRVVERYFMGD